MTLIFTLFHVLIGAIITYIVLLIVQKYSSKRKADKFLEEAKADAEVYKKDKILQAKEKFLQLKEEHEKTLGERERKTIEAENRAHAIVMKQPSTCDNCTHQRLDISIEQIDGTVIPQCMQPAGDIDRKPPAPVSSTQSA